MQTRDPRIRAGRSWDRVVRDFCFLKSQTVPHQDQRNPKNFALTRTVRGPDRAVRGSLMQTYDTQLIQ